MTRRGEGDGRDGHHPRCPQPWDACACAALWRVDSAVDNPYGLACAYGRFYDPNFDSDPWAPPEPYGGWSRALLREIA